MMTFSSLSQSIKNDSVHIHINTFKSIIKESRKHDSLKVRFDELYKELVNLTQKNNYLYDDFLREREAKNQLILKREEYQEDLKKLYKRSKLFDIGLGLSTGAFIDENLDFKPGIMIGLNVTILKL